MANDSIIQSNFWKNMLVIATIVGGVKYIEKSTTDTIKECLINVEYRIAMLEKVSENNAKVVSEINMTLTTNTYRLSAMDNLLNEIRNKKYIKPEEPKVPQE